MRLDLDRLPTDMVLLQQVVRDLAVTVERQEAALSEKDAQLESRDAELEKLRVLLAQLRRMRFGRSSEKRDPAQLWLALEALEEEIATREAARSPAAEVVAKEEHKGKAARRPLPADLPREEVRHLPEGRACPSCGGALHEIGEDVGEVLDYVPAAFKVIRHVRPRFACRACETITQMPAPSLPIERGRPGPGLLAQVLVAKYADHLPLYRQSEIYARSGVDLGRSTLADWVGRSSWLFAGSDAGGERAALIYSLIETCKLNGLDPYAYLRDVLARIADHPIKRIDEFLPWHWQARETQETAAP